MSEEILTRVLAITECGHSCPVFFYQSGRPYRCNILGKEIDWSVGDKHIPDDCPLTENPATLIIEPTNDS